jgi:hypothetical protein
MLPTVSARATIARQGISANASRKQTLRTKGGGKQNDVWRDNFRLPLPKCVLKAIPALPYMVVDWLIPFRLSSNLFFARPWHLSGGGLFAVDYNLQSESGTHGYAN